MSPEPAGRRARDVRGAREVARSGGEPGALLGRGRVGGVVCFAGFSASSSSIPPASVPRM